MLISDLALGEGRLLERGRLIERSVLVSVTIGQKLKDQITRIKELCEHKEKERTQSDLTEWKVFSCTDSDVFLSLRNTHSDNKYKRGNRTKKKRRWSSCNFLKNPHILKEYATHNLFAKIYS